MQFLPLLFGQFDPGISLLYLILSGCDVVGQPLLLDSDEKSISQSEGGKEIKFVNFLDKPCGVGYSAVVGNEDEEPIIP